MDEKMNDVLKGIYDSLTEEQKEKVKNLKTVEEMTEFAAKEGIEIPDDVLDAVAGGGAIFRPRCQSVGCEEHHRAQENKRIHGKEVLLWMRI